MFKIIDKQILNENCVLMKVYAPLIAKKAKPGQFIIFRINDHGERIPLTIADYDPIEGSVTIIFQKVGLSTTMLAELKVNDCIADFVGPLGMPTHLENIKKAVVIGGGVGCAIAYPQAKALFKAGAHVDIIAGFRSKNFVILESLMKKNCTNLFITTDDGSYGEQGFVTEKLSQLCGKSGDYDCVIAIGPVIMMKSVSEFTRKLEIKTIVSLNPIMIDGTGMCGGCRVRVGDEIKFACVDGPDFDGHLVDFDSLIKRNSFYKFHEQGALEHYCKMEGMNDA